MQPFFQTFSAIHQSDPVSKALLWNTSLFATLFSNLLRYSSVGSCFKSSALEHIPFCNPFSNFLRHSSAGFFLKNLLRNSSLLAALGSSFAVQYGRISSQNRCCDFRFQKAFPILPIIGQKGNVILKSVISKQLILSLILILKFPNIIVSKFNRSLTRKKIITTKQNKNIAINFLDRQIL